MITHMNMLILILLCGIVTLLIRIIPFIMISKVQLPDVVVRWLSFIPITLFTALVIDSIIQQTPHGEVYIKHPLHYRAHSDGYFIYNHA